VKFRPRALKRNVVGHQAVQSHKIFGRALFAAVSVAASSAKARVSAGLAAAGRAVRHDDHPSDERSRSTTPKSRSRNSPQSTPWRAPYLRRLISVEGVTEDLRAAALLL